MAVWKPVDGDSWASSDMGSDGSGDVEVGSVERLKWDESFNGWRLEYNMDRYSDEIDEERNS